VWRGLAVIGMGLLGGAVAISKGAVFFHPIALSVLPGAVTRLAVMVAVDGNVAALIHGGASYSDAPWTLESSVQRGRSV
jgi:hypothetical protein